MPSRARLIHHKPLPARQAVLGGPGGPSPRHRLAEAAPRRCRCLETAGDDSHPHEHHPGPGTDHGHRAAAGRAQRAHRRPGVLSRHRRVGRRRPGPVGPLRGALSGQRQRRLPQEGPLTAQIPDGPTDPGTAAGAADPGLLGGRRTHPHRRAARRRRAVPPGAAVHRRRGDPAPGGAEDPDHRAGMGRGPRHRSAPRPQLRRTPRVLDLGGRGCIAPHRDSNRGTDRTVAPQPHPVPGAGHRRADPAAADHPVEDRRGEAAGDFTGAGGCVVHHRRPHPRRPARRAAGGVLRQERTRLQPADAAAVPMVPPAGEPPGLRNSAAHLPRPRADRDRCQGRHRARPALHLPRLSQAVHHRRDRARHATTHRPNSSPATATSTPPWATRRSTPTR